MADTHQVKPEDGEIKPDSNDFIPSEDDFVVYKELPRGRYGVKILKDSHLWKEGMVLTIDNAIYHVSQKSGAKAVIKKEVTI